MDKSIYEVGETFYLKKPTKALIKKHSLDVGKYSLTDAYLRSSITNKGITINEIRFPNNWFNTTVIFLGQSERRMIGSSNKSLEGFDSIAVTIIDKESIKSAKNKRYLFGISLLLPTILLKKKGRIVDLRHLPAEAHKAVHVVAKRDTALLLGARLGKQLTQDNTPITELLAEQRKQHIAGYKCKQSERVDIDIGISSLLKPVIFSNQRTSSLRQSLLYCQCGMAVTFSDIMNRLVDHTDKKKPRYRYTFTCPDCRVKYVITLKEGTINFDGVGKNKKKKLSTEHEYIRLRRAANDAAFRAIGRM